MSFKTLGVCVLMVVGACGGGSAAPASAPAPSSLHRDPSVITQDELVDPAVSELTAYEAIQRLRPNFLSTRGTQTIAYPSSNGIVESESGKVHASIDNSGVLDLDQLKRIRASSVIEIRLLSPAAAMQRFGGSAKSGAVIAVRTM